MSPLKVLGKHANEQVLTHAIDSNMLKLSNVCSKQSVMVLIKTNSMKVFFMSPILVETQPLKWLVAHDQKIWLVAKTTTKAERELRIVDVN